jgi:hypothetical protein
MVATFHCWRWAPRRLRGSSLVFPKSLDRLLTRAAPKQSRDA